MKRCPECRRDYTDDTLLYCLEDGTALVQGSVASPDEPQTAILHETAPPGEAATRAQLPGTGQTAGLPSDTAQVPKRSFDKRLLAAPFLLAIIVLAGLSGYKYFSQTRLIESIAVMPFVNDSGNPDLEYLSDGMTETLIAGLTQLPNLSVKARSSVFRYKGRETDTRTIGKELNVQAILSGRVVGRGDQLTLSLELVDVATENAIWSQQYSRKQTDLVALQTEIARDVSGKLRSKLSNADAANVEKTYTSNPEAYKLYLQGRFYWNKREEKDFKRAIEFFDQAIALDPQYALAYAGLADTSALRFSYDFAPVTEIAIAREYAARSLSLDNSLAEPHAVLAITSEYQYDWAGAEREFKRSIELNPNYPTAHQWYGEMLTCMGRFDEALAEHRRATEIDPLSLPLNWTYGRAFYFARRYDEAIAQLNKAVDLDPSFARTHRTLAEFYRIKKDFGASVESRAKFFELSGNPQAGALVRQVYAKDGWPAFLRLSTDSQLLADNPWVRAKAYVELGEKDAAFAQLEKAYENRSTSLLWLKIEPGLDVIRDDPRYKSLLKRMNLAE